MGLNGGNTKDEQIWKYPRKVTTLEMIAKIHDMVLNDGGIKALEIVEATSIWQDIVYSNLHEKLDKKKIATKTDAVKNKPNRVIDSECVLAFFRRNPDELLRRYMTVDETWMHHCTS